MTSAGVSIDSTGSPTARVVPWMRPSACGGRPARRLAQRPCERSCRGPRHGRAVAFAGVVERVAVEVRGVAPADQREALAGEEQAVDRGVAELPRARRRRGRGRVAARYRQSSTPPCVTTRIVRPRARSAIAVTAATARALNSTQRLAALGRELRIVAPPAQRVGGPARVDLGVGVALEGAEAALAQAAVGRDRQIARTAAIACAVSNARTRSLEKIASMPSSASASASARGLPATALAERGVELALHAHLGVPRPSRRGGRRRSARAPRVRPGSPRHALQPGQSAFG